MKTKTYAWLFGILFVVAVILLVRTSAIYKRVLKDNNIDPKTGKPLSPTAVTQNNVPVPASSVAGVSLA